MPTRMPRWPEIHPISGRMSSPGITHSDATENPVARALAGMARDSATRMLGPSTANDAEIRQLIATATKMLGASANPIDSSDVAAAILAPKRMTARMSPPKRRVTMRAPTTRPTNWKGSEIAAATPRARSSRPNSSSYISDASVTNPMSDVARNGRLHHSRRRLSTLCTVRQLSANDGAVSSVLITSSVAPIAWRSQRPRTGSRNRIASTAKITVGTTNTRNGTRQLNE